MRKKLYAGNWKMNKGVSETEEFLRDFWSKFTDKESSDLDAEYVVFPQAATISDVKRLWREEGENRCDTLGIVSFYWGVQNMHWETNGAFTGELAPSLVRELGCRYVLAGHSERRQYFNESNESAAKRAVAAHENGMRAILCVGESLEQRESGKMFEVLDAQCKAMTDLSSSMPEGFVLAYEPVWAIGTGKTATSDQAQEVHKHLRDYFTKAWGERDANRLRILYGGSVKPNNSKDLMSQPDIDGVLVGGASLDPNSFFEIAGNAKEC